MKKEIKIEIKTGFGIDGWICNCGELRHNHEQCEHRIEDGKIIESSVA